MTATMKVTEARALLLANFDRYLEQALGDIELENLSNIDLVDLIEDFAVTQANELGVDRMASR